MLSSTKIKLFYHILYGYPKNSFDKKLGTYLQAINFKSGDIIYVHLDHAMKHFP